MTECMDAVMAQLDEDGNGEVSKEEFGPWFFALDAKGMGMLGKAEKQVRVELIGHARNNM